MLCRDLVMEQHRTLFYTVRSFVFSLFIECLYHYDKVKI